MMSYSQTLVVTVSVSTIYKCSWFTGEVVVIAVLCGKVGVDVFLHRD